MSVANPYLQYQQNAVQSANPGELVVMLYDGLVKFLKMSIVSLEDKDISGANNSLVRSQDIINYLNNTLDDRFELSKNLSALYDFMNRELVEANINKDTAKVNEVLDLVTELRDAWRQAVKLSNSLGE